MRSYKQRILTIAGLLGVLILGAIGLAYFTFERPAPLWAQWGYRGTGMVYIKNQRAVEKLQTVNEVPFSVPYAGNVGPKAGATYKNIQVLGDVDAGEFTRLMVNMTTWVAPAQGCAACHNVADFADDAKYTKHVARRMLQMVRHINSEWTAHVKQTGVTCYTCHRGNLVPPKTWYTPVPPRSSQALLGNKAGQNARLPADVVGMTSLPNDPFTPFLQGAQQIRVVGPTALPTTNRSSIKQAEWTYGLMMHMSAALGVNCTYCHNTRAFYSWQESAPQRVTAWYGIRMVRDINNNYINRLAPLYGDVPERKGPAGDLPKVFCATCHNGVYKPLFGTSMLQGANGFPELREAATQ